MSIVSEKPVQFSKREPPDYFLRIQQSAQRRWDQLESDLELAGPWHQLFRQVQSPRHVISELLQNADDVGARSASARIEGDTFIFEHDGIDFDAEQFASLCRFGFSNKRKLHTIGFRGIGFKSTFSLGDAVEVITPKLAVRFDRKRFTEPQWISDGPITTSTIIRVRIADLGRKRELEKNFAEWSNSLASLLFFQNIHRLRIADRAIERKIIGPGPIEDSEIVTLTGAGVRMLIVLKSPEEAFPDEALDEVRQERMGGGDEFSLPPCRVELVLGLEGDQRLYVILPTDVRPDLPFSCNAPFVQDPARTGIKDPVISPTNRWLLNRVGILAASAMGEWLGKTSLSLEDRARAYALLPKSGLGEDTITGECETAIRESFVKAAPQTPLLTVTGNLSSKDCCIAPPANLYAVWSAPELVQIFGKAGQQDVFAAEVEAEDRKRLERWGWIETISNDDVIEALERVETISKPDNWRSLVLLWGFVQSLLPYDWQGRTRRKLKLLPVEGGNYLASSEIAVRLSTNKTQLSDEDWQFISARLKVIERDWLAHLFPPQRRKEQENDSAWLSARELLQAIGMDSPTSPDELVLRAYEDLLRQATVPIAELVRLTHIIAGLDATVPANFNYATRDTHLRGTADGLVADFDGALELILPEAIAQEHLLHEDYYAAFKSCSQQRWEAWAMSSKSGLRTFIGIESSKNTLYGREKLNRFVKDRLGEMPLNLPLKTPYFRVHDFNFNSELLAHWTALAGEDPQVWAKLVGLLAIDPGHSWRNRSTITVVQPGSTYEHSVQCESLMAAWVMWLRGLPCLQDTHGIPRQPAELLRRSPQTEALMDVEDFVKAEMDTASTQDLLELLGVRASPTGTDKLLDRLRALASVTNPPTHEVMKWYSRLDQLLPRCSTDDVADAKAAFTQERLILTTEGEWVKSGDVFQTADEDSVPGAPIIHGSARHLTLWTRLDVAERPTVELILSWIKQLKSHEALGAADLKRVRASLQRYPGRIWEECAHWLTLDGTWTPVGQLEFGLTMQGLTKWGELFPAIKARTANLQMLPAAICEKVPFSNLKSLAGAIHHRITERQRDLPPPQHKPWIAALGQALRRINLSDESIVAHIRATGERLAMTAWQTFQTLRVTPYIGFTPAGQPYSPEVLWHEHHLYVRDGKLAKAYNAIVDELARPFGQAQIGEAIRACIERDEQFIAEYMEDNFDIQNALTICDHDVKPEAPARPDSGTVPATEANVDRAEHVEGTGQLEPSQSAPPTDGEEGNHDDEEQKPRAKRPPEPTLIEQYVRVKGFHWDGARNRYVHPDGSWLQKCEGSFNWELHSSDGNVKMRYWASEQSLLNGGIEIAADCWEAMRRDPMTHSLVVRSEDHRPLELGGVELVRMEAGGAITLFPAKYRLRKTSE